MPLPPNMVIINYLYYIICIVLRINFSTIDDILVRFIESSALTGFTGLQNANTVPGPIFFPLGAA